MKEAFTVDEEGTDAIEEQDVNIFELFLVIILHCSRSLEFAVIILYDSCRSAA